MGSHEFEYAVLYVDFATRSVNERLFKSSALKELKKRDKINDVQILRCRWTGN